MLCLILTVMADPLEDVLAPLDQPSEQRQFAASTVAELQHLLARATEANANADVTQRECLAEPTRYLVQLPDLAVRSQTALGTYLSSQDQIHASLELRRLAVTLSKGQQLGAQVDWCMRRGDGLAGTERSSNNPNYRGLAPVDFLSHEDVLVVLPWFEEPCGSCY